MSNEQNIGGVRVWVSDKPTVGHLEILQPGATGNEMSAAQVIAKLTRERDEARAELVSEAEQNREAERVLRARLSAHARVVEAARKAECMCVYKSPVNEENGHLASCWFPELDQALADLDAGKAV